MSKFIEITLSGTPIGTIRKKKISVDNIASVDEDRDHSIITLNEVVDGNNVKVKAVESKSVINTKITLAN